VVVGGELLVIKMRTEYALNSMERGEGKKKED